MTDTPHTAQAAIAHIAALEAANTALREALEKVSSVGVNAPCSGISCGPANSTARHVCLVHIGGIIARAALKQAQQTEQQQ